MSESQTMQEQSTLEKISDDILNRISEFTEVTLKLPHTIFIGSLRHDGYKLTQSIPVSIEYENDVVIASFYDVDMYGVGNEIQEAITDLCSQIVEVYELYSQNEHRLGPVPEREWKYLQTIIRPVER